MRKPKHAARPTRPTFAVVVEGETESWYLQMLKRNENNIRVNIEPKIPQKKSISEQYRLVCSLADSEYTKVFWIVDLDTIIKEENEAAREKQSPLSVFMSYRAELYEAYPNVEVIVNNPCLEFWFLLHFERTSKSFNACSETVERLGRYIHGYEKTQKFFTKPNKDIYLKLKPDLATAIQNAKTLGRFDEDEPMRTLSEMPLLFLTEELNTILNPS